MNRDQPNDGHQDCRDPTCKRERELAEGRGTLLFERAFPEHRLHQKIYAELAIDGWILVVEYMLSKGHWQRAAVVRFPPAISAAENLLAFIRSVSPSETNRSDDA
jgi:hypothetical protein